jgi:hypothetical protein
MPEAALLDVRVLPWRPRARVMDPEVLREGSPLLDFSDLTGRQRRVDDRALSPALAGDRADP